MSEQDPTKILRDKVQDLKKEHKFEEALLLENQILDFQKKNTPENYWIERGLFLCQSGKYEEALECFDKNLTINSNSYVSLYEKGKTLYEMKRYGEALECFFKAYENEHSSIEKRSVISGSLKLNKKIEDVLVQTNKDNKKLRGPEMWYYLAVTLTKLMRYEEAIEIFTHMADVAPHDSDIFYEWARCELLSNNLKKCLELLKKASEMDQSIARLLRIDPDFDTIRNDEQFRILCQKDRIA